MCLTEIQAIMLNRAKRDLQKLPDTIGIVEGQTVADIGLVVDTLRNGLQKLLEKMAKYLQWTPTENYCPM